MKPRLLFIILAVASFFSVAYVTGIIKETRYVYDVVVKEAEYDKSCLQKSGLGQSNFLLPSHCITKEAVWGYKDCDFRSKQHRIKVCFGIKEFSPMKTGVLALVSLTGLMYFRIRKQ